VGSSSNAVIYSWKGLYLSVIRCDCPVLGRDIKPNNFMWDSVLESGCLIDFDVSEQYDASNPPNLCIGTPGYLAPEVENGRQYDFKCDIYSVGVLFLELLFQFPVKGWTSPEVISKLLSSLDSENLAHRLLQEMLRDSPQSRPSAIECCNHAYFREYHGDQKSNSKSKSKSRSKSSSGSESSNGSYS